MVGFGVAAACFVMVMALPAFTAGARFIDNAVFSKVYGLFVTGTTLVPLLAWRGTRASRRPRYVQVAWLPWLYLTAHGVLYSHDRGSGNLLVLIAGWGFFVFGGTIGMYFLGWELWGKTEGESIAADGDDSPAST
ncbi:hypothetical protein GCM10010361_18190 [Streptomyces olivaceiscleroticus]|uniref:Integral membrane protein n=1 Tax=Streptomyces olivaceiscleroticus TaxID=68245 RepID=A0ABN0ZPN8_9ACTN